jgi:tetratricopeptide (TPR) repeat protein
MSDERVKSEPAVLSKNRRQAIYCLGAIVAVVTFKVVDYLTNGLCGSALSWAAAFGVALLTLFLANLSGVVAQELVLALRKGGGGQGVSDPCPRAPRERHEITETKECPPPIAKAQQEQEPTSAAPPGPLRAESDNHWTLRDLGKEPCLTSDERITALPAPAATLRCDAEWHVIHGGKEVGPLSLAELVGKAALGDIEADDLVKQAGGLWTKARDFRFLRQQFLRQDSAKGTSPTSSSPAQGTAQDNAQIALAPVQQPGSMDYERTTRSPVSARAAQGNFELAAGIIGWGIFFVLVGAVPVLCCFGVCSISNSTGNSDTAGERRQAADQGDNAAPGQFQAPGRTIFAEEAYERGNAWLAKKEYPQAIAEYNEAIRLDPRYAEAYTSRGFAWCNNGDCDKAMADCTEAIRLDPKNAEAYCYRGFGWCCKEDYDTAIRDFDEAIRLEPQVAGNYHGRGYAWFQKQDYDKAIRDFNEALRISPNHAGASDYCARAHIGRSGAWMEKKDYDEVIKDCNEAVRLDPKNAGHYACRAIARAMKKDYDKAIVDFDEAIRLDPRDTLAYIDRGLAWSSKKEYDRAIMDFDEAIRLDPKNARAFQNRGNARWENREFDKAKKDWIEAHRLDPKSF